MTTTSAPDVYCVMGHPVEHSRSPWIHARFAELTGQRIAYTRRLVPLDGFARALADFAAAGGAGCNVTVPFKHDAARLATHASDRVRRAGAANTLSFRADGTVHAENTDGLGLVADIVVNAGVALAGRDVLLVGAGGAAAGVLAPLLDQAPGGSPWRTAPKRARRPWCRRTRTSRPAGRWCSRRCRSASPAPASTWSSTPRPAAWPVARCPCRTRCCARAPWPTT